MNLPEDEPDWVKELRTNIAECDEKIKAAEQALHKLREQKVFLLKRLPPEALR